MSQTETYDGPVVYELLASAEEEKSAQSVPVKVLIIIG